MFRFTDLIIFELTRSCNLNCTYCYQNVKPKNEIIPTDMFCNIIDRICEQRILNNRRDILLNLNFHGGECTLVGKEKFKAFVEYATKTFSNNNLNFKLGLQTNGTLLDDEWLDIFKFYNLSVGISFDGIYENQCQRCSSLLRDRIYRNILECKKRGVQVGVLSVVNTSNAESLRRDKKAFEKKNISTKLNYMEDTNNPLNSSLELSGTDIFNKFLKREIQSFLKTGRLDEYHSKEILFSTLIDILTVHEPSYDTGCDGRFCGAGITMIAVRPDGSMGYCDRYSDDCPENYIQNALDYDFLGLKQLKTVVSFDLKKSRILRETGCDHCRASYMCNTGCMAFYFSKFKKYGIQKNIVCDQFLNFYDYVQKNLLTILKTLEKNDILIEAKSEILDISFEKSDFLYRNNIALERTSPFLIKVKRV